MKKLFVLTVFFTLYFSLLNFKSFAQLSDWLWAKSAVGYFDGDVLGVCTDHSGNVYITGHFDVLSITLGSITLTNSDPLGGLEEIFIAKYDASGNVLWAKRAGSSDIGGSDGVGKSICSDDSGNIYITGYFASPHITFGSITLTNADTSGVNWYSDVFIVKYDASGNVLWAKRAGGYEEDRGYGVSTDCNGNVYITGCFTNSIIFGADTLSCAGVFPHNSGIFLVKYDAMGNVLWAKNISEGYGYSVSTDCYGNVFVTGNSTSLGLHTITMKCDSSGNLLWTKNVGVNNNYGTSVSADDSGNVFITGLFGGYITFDTITLTGNNNSYSIFILKYDSSGKILWAKYTGLGSDNNSGSSVRADKNGNVFLTCGFNNSIVTFGSSTIINSDTSGTTDDIFIGKYDAAGNALWAQSAGGNDDDMGNSVSIDSSGDIFLTGDFSSSNITFGSTILTTTGYNNIFLAKLSSSAGINEKVPENFISLFPNPATNNITIEAPQAATIEISNIQGQLIKIFEASGKTNVDVSALPNGVYIVEMKTGKGVVVKKFIKE